MNWYGTNVVAYAVAAAVERMDLRIFIGVSPSTHSRLSRICEGRFGRSVADVRPLTPHESTPFRRQLSAWQRFTGWPRAPVPVIAKTAPSDSSALCVMPDAAEVTKRVERSGPPNAQDDG